MIGYSLVTEICI